MFDLPQTKRVRRDELYSPASSVPATPDPDLQEAFRNRCSELFDVDNTPDAGNHSPGNAARPESKLLGPEENEPRHHVDGAIPATGDAQSFRLFRNVTVSAIQESQTYTAGVVGTLYRAERPPSYYFASTATPADRSRFACVALSGEQVREMSSRPCPGMEYSWRVINACVSKVLGRTQYVVVKTHSDSERRSHRVRAGKKARIKIRKALQRLREKSAAKELAAEEKAAHEREKKTRLNRLKQIKKREKERERKKLMDCDEAVGPVDITVLD